MANPEHLEILKQGVEVWNNWRKDNPDVEIDLMEADLYAADLRDTNLMRANLQDANLMGANLYAANLRGANLERALLRAADLRKVNLERADLREANLMTANLYASDLSEVHLEGANLKEANLIEVYLRKADLREANLERADLREADLTASQMGNTILGNNDLSESIGLETISHFLPSTLGIDTIRRSKGRIPIEFLRGCGLSDLDIEYSKLAATGLDPEQVTQITYEIHHLYSDQPIRFYSCFISFNSKDQNFAQRLHDDLQDNGVRCWFAPEDMKIGDQIRPTIDQQIRLRDKLLVILSENSVKSEWVGDEVEAALEEEKESGRLVLFPIRLEDTALNIRDGWMAKIKRTRHIGDFSNWKDEGSYWKAFERLLRDLKAT